MLGFVGAGSWNGVVLKVREARTESAGLASRSRREARCAVPRMAADGALKGDKRSITIQKPLGVVLEELGATGAVYVADIVADGNAAKASGLSVGDRVLAVRGTDGGESDVSKAGLDAVLAAINAAAGGSVTLTVQPRDAAAESRLNSGFNPKSKAVSPNTRDRLRREISAPYRQNWILIIVAVVSALAIASKILVF